MSRPARRPTSRATDLVSLMVGRELGQFYPETAARAARSRASRSSVAAFVAGAGPTGGVVRSSTAAKSSVSPGLEGQGQREIIRALAGLVPAAAGAATKDDARRRDGRARPRPLSARLARASVSFPRTASRRGSIRRSRSSENIGLGMLRGASMVSTRPGRSSPGRISDAGHERARPRREPDGLVAVRRQPAEGHDRAVARVRRRHAADRGADARRRRRRQGGNLSRCCASSRTRAAQS